MPNNRNRNRNRNRNKRNRNQNQNQTQVENPSQKEEEIQQEEGEEQLDSQPELVRVSSSLENDNGNSGNVSNGPAASHNNSSEKSENVVTNTLVENQESEENVENSATLIQGEEDLADEMGAKNSKHQKEKSAKRGNNGKVDEEQVRPGPTIIRRPPGSPRQAKVIVHRVVREEDQVDGEAKILKERRVSKEEEEEVKVAEEKQQEELATEQVQEVSQPIEISPSPEEIMEKEESPKEEAPKEQSQEPKEPEQYVLQLEKAMEFVENAHKQHVALVQDHGRPKEEKNYEELPVQPVAQEQQNLKDKAQNLKDQKEKEAQQHQEAEESTKNLEENSNKIQEPAEAPPKVIEKILENLQVQGKQEKIIPDPIIALLPQKPQHTSKVIIHQIRLETDDEERSRKGKPTIEEISSTPGSLLGTLSPPPRYLVESPKNVSSAGQFSKFARDVQIQELELTSDCSSGEFNSLQSPLVCEVDSESEGSTAGVLGPERSPSDPPLPSSSNRVEQQEQLRQKRAQKRNALESHFLPQLLNPRYLDSILEENGETQFRNHQAAATASSSGGNDQAGNRTPKLNETFPKSQLDFSRRHKRREEAPMPLKLETKFLEEPSDLESCSRLQSTLSPQSEDAELVYLSSSASSSVSDLMELELEQAAALAERALVDLDTDASRLIHRPDDEMSSTSTTTADRSETEAETEAETETETEREATESRESTPVNALTPTPTPVAAEREPRLARDSADADTNVSGGSSASFGAASALAATREEFVRNMDKVRELIEMTRREQEQGEDSTRSPSPPPVPPPPQYTASHVDSTQYTPSSTSSSQLLRQESCDSHCSDSTTHSQCTAINLASPPLPLTPPIRQKPAPATPSITPTPQPEPSELSVAGEDPDTDTEAIKKLRLLCTEQLASMPYGEQVLEELATVAQNIAEPNRMPYPMPQLPHIKELQLSQSESGKSSSAWLGLPTQSDPQLLVCLSPGQRELVDAQTQPDDLLDAHQKFVERRGYHELSKAQVQEQEELQQQQREQEQQQTEMLKTAAMMRELRKSLSPSNVDAAPPPVPPPPVPVKSAETAAKATASASAHPNAKRDDASGPKQKIAIESSSSSLENKPRRAADHPIEQQQQQSAENRQSSQTIRTAETMTSSTASSTKFPTLDRMFPAQDIFEEQRKRFSNIEFPTSQPQSQTKRYSNIETSSYESKKRLENGQVVYDVSSSSHEKKQEGEQPPPVAPPIPRRPLCQQRN